MRMTAIIIMIKCVVPLADYDDDSHINNKSVTTGGNEHIIHRRWWILNP